MEIIDKGKTVQISRLQELAQQQFGGELVKAVVDIEKGIMAIGGSMHADEEALLIEMGSNQENLWGINIKPNDKEMIEFDSMINIRPNQNNRSRSVENKDTQELIRAVVAKLVS